MGGHRTSLTSAARRKIINTWWKVCQGSFSSWWQPQKKNNIIGHMLFLYYIRFTWQIPVVVVLFKTFSLWHQSRSMVMKVLSLSGHCNSKCYIVGNWNKSGYLRCSTLKKAEVAWCICKQFLNNAKVDGWVSRVSFTCCFLSTSFFWLQWTMTTIFVCLNRTKHLP